MLTPDEKNRLARIAGREDADPDHLFLVRLVTVLVADNAHLALAEEHGRAQREADEERARDNAMFEPRNRRDR